MAQATGSLAQLWGSNFLKSSQHPPNILPTPGHHKNLTQATGCLALRLLCRPNTALVCPYAVPQLKAAPNPRQTEDGVRAYVGTA